MSEVCTSRVRAGVPSIESLHFGGHTTCDSVLHKAVAGVTHFLVSC